MSFSTNAISLNVLNIQYNIVGRFLLRGKPTFCEKNIADLGFYKSVIGLTTLWACENEFFLKIDANARITSYTSIRIRFQIH